MNPYRITTGCLLKKYMSYKTPVRLDHPYEVHAGDMQTMGRNAWLEVCAHSYFIVQIAIQYNAATLARSGGTQVMRAMKGSELGFNMEGL